MKSNIKKIPLILFGLLLTAVILEITLRIGGFIILSMQEHRNLQSIQEKGVYRIMCLGESTTQNQYPIYLQEILNQRNIGIKFSVIDKGKTGTTTTAMLSQLEANIATYNPDMIVTMMGCNDDGRVMYYKDIPEADTGIFQHCRLYRFGRIIYMHIANKLKEKRIYGFNSAFLDKEHAVRKDIELNLENDSAYLELGRRYGYQGRFIESEQAYKKAIELNPKSYSAYLELGWFYGGQSRFTESEQAFKKAIELNSHDAAAYLGLGSNYEYSGRYAESIQAYKKALEVDSKSYFACAGLGRLYAYRGRFIESIEAYKKAIELNPKRDIAYGALGVLYGERDKPELSKEYHARADEVRSDYINPNTLNNYLKLKQILDKRNIRLVRVQYPVRNIEPLKKMFKPGDRDNIIFVDNEKIFKDAIRKQGYKEYFVDMFAGDFGHCTQKGNRLLAENIADTILKEVFHK